MLFGYMFSKKRYTSLQIVCFSFSLFQLRLANALSSSQLSLSPSALSLQRSLVPRPPLMWPQHPTHHFTYTFLVSSCSPLPSSSPPFWAFCKNGHTGSTEPFGGRAFFIPSVTSPYRPNFFF